MSTDFSKLTSAPLSDVCSRKHGGNQQSELSNARIHSRKEIDRDRILKLAEARGSYGITVKEVAAAFGKFPNCVSGRLTELKNETLLEPNGEEREHSAVLIIPAKGQLDLLEVK